MILYEKLNYIQDIYGNMVNCNVIYNFPINTFYSMNKLKYRELLNIA